jgi:hypothetical protein
VVLKKLSLVQKWKIVTIGSLVIFSFGQLSRLQLLKKWIKIPSCNGGKNSRVDRRHPYE